MRRLLLATLCTAAVGLAPVAFAAGEESHSTKTESTHSGDDHSAGSKDPHSDSHAEIVEVKSESQVGVVDADLPNKAAIAVTGLLLFGIAVVGFSGAGRGPAPEVQVSGDSHH